jgi:hypothetical protein
MINKRGLNGSLWQVLKVGLYRPTKVVVARRGQAELINFQTPINIFNSMQVVGKGLRNGTISQLLIPALLTRHNIAGLTSLSLQPHQIASSSRTQWNSRRRCVRTTATAAYLTRYHSSASFLNPIKWLREKTAPTIHKRRSPEEFAEAREKLAEEGKQSVFDNIPKEEIEPAVEVKGKKKKVFTEVCR